MSPRPLIGVTKPERGGLFSFACAWASLWLSGARPVALTAASPRDHLRLDGLLLSGGSDVHPPLFKIAPKDGYPYDLRREAMELGWLAKARTADLPTLGICRGAQLMNVAAGGALHMDLAEAFQGTRYPRHWLEQLYFRKRIQVEPRSVLASALGEADLWVHSIHRQAVRLVGDGLSVSAREGNGAIQAVEDPRRRFWLGVQFHPEFLFYRSRARRLFGAFVAAARQYADVQGSASAPSDSEAAARRAAAVVEPGSQVAKVAGPTST